MLGGAVGKPAWILSQLRVHLAVAFAEEAPPPGPVQVLLRQKRELLEAARVAGFLVLRPRGLPNVSSALKPMLRLRLVRVQVEGTKLFSSATGVSTGVPSESNLAGQGSEQPFRLRSPDMSAVEGSQLVNAVVGVESFGGLRGRLSADALSCRSQVGQSNQAAPGALPRKVGRLRCLRDVALRIFVMFARVTSLEAWRVSSGGEVLSRPCDRAAVSMDG